MRRSYGDNKEKSTSITVKIAESLAVRIDEYWKKAGMASRSELIETASEAYISSQKCPTCGAINPKNGIRCSVCGENIGDYKKLIDSVNNQFKQIDDALPSLRQKYDMCLATIKALKLDDYFLFRRFDLITAKLKGLNSSKDTAEPYYFIECPKWETPYLDKSSNYELYGADLGYQIHLLKFSFYYVMNEKLPEDDSPGYHNSNYQENVYFKEKVLSAMGGREDVAMGWISSFLNTIQNTLDNISQELDQISEYITLKAKETDKKGKK